MAGAQQAIEFEFKQSIIKMRYKFSQKKRSPTFLFNFD